MMVMVVFVALLVVVGSDGDVCGAGGGDGVLISSLFSFFFLDVFLFFQRPLFILYLTLFLSTSLCGFSSFHKPLLIPQPLLLALF